MNKRFAYKALGVTLASVALFVLQKQFYWVNIILHSVVDIFAGGRSVVKLDLFLVYSFVVSFLAAIFFWFGKQMNFKKFGLKWVLVFVVLAYANQLAAHFALMRNLDSDPFKFAVVLNKGEITSNTLLHNHSMKAVNAKILEMFGSANFENVDAGLAVANFVPPFYVYVGMIMVFLAGIMFLALVFKWSAEQNIRLSVFLLFLISSFSLLKNMTDGGILNRETLAALSLFLGVVIYQENFLKIKDAAHKIYVSIAPILLYALIILVLVVSSKVNLGFVQTSLFNWSVYASFAIAAIFYLFRPKWEKIILILFAAILFFPVAAGIKRYEFASRNLINKSAVMGLYGVVDPSLQARFFKIAKIGNINIYEGAFEDNTSLYKLWDRLGLLGNLSAVTLPQINCATNAPKYEIKLTVKTLQPIKLMENNFNYLKIAEIKPGQSSRSKWLSYRLKLEFDSCAPRAINLVHELLKLNGSEPFVITNISQRNAVFN